MRQELSNSDNAEVARWRQKINDLQTRIGDEADNGTLVPGTLGKTGLGPLFWEIDTLQRIIVLRALEDQSKSSCKFGLQVLVYTLSLLFNPNHKGEPPTGDN